VTTVALPAKWEAAARTLAAGGTITDAARASGLRRESVSRRWNRQDETGGAFRALVARIRAQAGDPLAEHRAAAQEVLADALAGDAPPATRVRAALEILRSTPPITTGTAPGAFTTTSSTTELLDADEAVARVAAAVHGIARAVRAGTLTPSPAVAMAFHRSCADAADLTPRETDRGAPVAAHVQAEPAPAAPPAQPSNVVPLTPAPGYTRGVDGSLRPVWW